MTFYRLRPGSHQPAFRYGEAYKYLSRDTVPGYIFLSLNGKPRCVPEQDFEPVVEPLSGEMGRGSQTVAC
jgi:hypothetical protein